jgi:hypothetical protein
MVWAEGVELESACEPIDVKSSETVIGEGTRAATDNGTEEDYGGGKKAGMK